jgi:hypothetical protein
LNEAYDFRKKVAVNFESQQAAAAKVGSYGITIGIDMMVLTLMANMAARVGAQVPYSHAIDQKEVPVSSCA